MLIFIAHKQVRTNTHTLSRFNELQSLLLVCRQTLLESSSSGSMRQSLPCHRSPSHERYNTVGVYDALKEKRRCDRSDRGQKQRERGLLGVVPNPHITYLCTNLKKGPLAQPPKHGRMRSKRRHGPKESTDQA